MVNLSLLLNFRAKLAKGIVSPYKCYDITTHYTKHLEKVEEHKQMLNRNNQVRFVENNKTSEIIDKTRHIRNKFKTAVNMYPI